MLLITYALVAFTVGPLSLAPHANRVAVRMEATPSEAPAAAKVVQESTPESMAAAKAAYDENKAKRVAKKAPKVGAVGEKKKKKKKKNSQFDKAKRIGAS
jgi:hypothetical protein